MSGSDYTLTPNLGLYKPNYNADVDNWGFHLNDNADVLDAAVGAGAINVRNYGAKGDGVTDDTAAFVEAIAAQSMVYVPPGKYRITSTLFLRSGTGLIGAGSGQSIIMPYNIPNWTGPTGDVEFGYTISNTNMNVYGSWSPIAPGPGNQTDHDITVQGLGFDFTNQIGGMIARFCYAANIYINDIRADLPTRDPTSTDRYSGFNLLSCDNVYASNIYCRQGWNIFDMWGGVTRVKIINMTVEGSLNPVNGGAINFNGVNTVNTQCHSKDLLVENCTIWCYGGADTTALFLDGMSAGSSSSDMLFSNVRIVARTGVSQGIIGRGLGGRIKLRGVIMAAEPGASFSTPIVLGALFGLTNITGTGLVVTTNGSSLATVTVPGGTTAGPGNCLSIDNGSNGPVAGNGVSLHGYYVVTAFGTYNSTAHNYNTVIIQLPNAATASGPINVSTRLSEFFGTYNDCDVTDITFDGVVASGAALVSLQGSGHIVDGVTVTQNYNGASSPQYYSVVGIDGTMDAGHLEPWRSSTVANVTATPGTAALPGGWSGDHVVCWQEFGTVPWLTNINGAIVVAGVTYPGTANLNIVGSSGGSIVFYAAATQAGYVNTSGITSDTGMTIANGASWTSGGGAPSATAPRGSLYSRVGGAVGATLYVSQGGGSWLPVAGV